MAQVCFADSLDLTGELPGDILLVFMDAEQDPEPEALLLEWQLLGQPDLVTAAQVPDTGYPVTACYGAIHRTFDYPEDGDLFRDYDQGYALPVIEGTKIGGVPRWIQYEPEVLPGRFIAAVGSIQPAYDAAYPWLNVPAPIETFQALYGEEQLMWGGDMGSLYLFLNDEGMVHAVVQGY